MTERNEMPTPVPMWLRELAVKHVGRTTDPAYLSWSKGDWTYAVCELLWERGEREPVDPDLIEAREIVVKWYGHGQTENIANGMEDDSLAVSVALLAIRRGRELAEAKP